MAKRPKRRPIDRLSKPQAESIYLSQLANACIMRDNILKAISLGLDPDTCSRESWTAAGLMGEPKSRLLLKLENNKCAELAHKAGIEHKPIKL